MDNSVYVLNLEPKKYMNQAIIYERGLNFFEGNKPLYLNLDVFKPGARTLKIIFSMTSLLSEKIVNRKESKDFIHVSLSTHFVCEARSLIVPNKDDNFIVETVTELNCNLLIEESLDVIQIEHWNPNIIIARNFIWRKNIILRHHSFLFMTNKIL